MCIVLVSIAGGHILVELGARGAPLSAEHLPSAFAFSAEGSRAMLSAIGTAMITVAGVAFSITVVALSLASSEYSPRVLRQFMRDRTNQSVLGVFVGVFSYCLTVLPRIHGGHAEAPVPAGAVVGGIVYALVGVGCLIAFLHHVASSIQVSCIVAEIAAETRVTSDHMFTPEPRPNEAPHAVDAKTERWHSIDASDSGYIQLVGADELLRVAEKRGIAIRMEQRVGEFVLAGTPLVSVDVEPRDALAAEVRDAITISRTRTIEQDVLFGVRQIVDVALRALSPSLNDPTTATLCVDHLNAILLCLAKRPMGDRTLIGTGRARVVVRGPTFRDVLTTAYDEIDTNVGAHVGVLRAMLTGLRWLGQSVETPARKAAIAARVVAVGRRAEAAGTATGYELARHAMELSEWLSRVPVAGHAH